MIRIQSHSAKPPKAIRLWHDLLLWLRNRLEQRFQIDDGVARYTFRCDTLREIGRYYNFFLKEPGTVQWIRTDVAPGQTFFDIGANIGVYTLQAARRVGPEGRVFAFEPHSANFTRLLENIYINGLQQTVVPCNFALNNEVAILPFNYSSLATGTSDSQLSSLRSFGGETYTPQLSEMKSAWTVDALISRANFPAPHHVKIDVDGNEERILQGMETVLRSDRRPASIQIEISPSTREAIEGFMDRCGYALSATHVSAGVALRISKGADAGGLHFNGIFRPRT
jgi:FkbM family methyltransferase